MSTPMARGKPMPRGTGILEDAVLSATRDHTDVVTEPVTPHRLTVAASPSTNRSTIRPTPRIGVGAPSTPYGLRAMQRRATSTPGRDRRKSGRMQRETPFDILRNLGRALAPTSQPICSSPEEDVGLQKEDKFDDLDNEPDIERPRLSLPIDDSVEEKDDDDDDDDESPEIQPPRLSLPFEEDTTQRSVEYPRRALSELARSSRMSFGDVRLSENFADLSRLDGASQDDDYASVQQDEGDEVGNTTIIQNVFSAGGETEDLGPFKLDFNFPTPNVMSTAVPDAEPEHNDNEEFVLNVMDVQPSADFLSSEDDATGTFGLNVRTPDQLSDSRTTGVVRRLQDEPALRGRKLQKLSRHKIPVPNLPYGVIKRLATRYARVGAGAKTKINKETLVAIEQATEWFFEQASEDLATYSRHAGRKTIDESDVLTLMKRQRHVNGSTTVFSLAQKHLPKELLQDMRFGMPP